MSTVKRYCTKSYLAKHPELHIEDYQLIEDLPQSQPNTTSISTTTSVNTTSINTTVTQQPSSESQAPTKPSVNLSVKPAANLSAKPEQPAAAIVSWADRQPTAAAIASWADEEWDWLECFDYFHERFPNIPRINPTRAEWEAKQLLLKQQEEAEKLKQSQPHQADGKAGDEAEKTQEKESARCQGNEGIEATKDDWAESMQLAFELAATWSSYSKMIDEWGSAFRAQQTLQPEAKKSDMMELTEDVQREVLEMHKQPTLIGTN